MKTLMSLVLLWGTVAEAGPKAREGFDWEAVSLYAIQDRGRLKPLDTFAIESVQFITGKTQWNGLSAVEVVFGWLLAYETEWSSERFVRVAYGPLKEKAGLDAGRQFFSPKELKDNVQLQSAIRETLQKQRSGDRLSPLDKKFLDVHNQLGLVEAMVTGQVFNVLPPPTGTQDPWLSLASLNDPAEPLPYNAATVETVRRPISQMVEAFSKQSGEQWNKASVELAGALATGLVQQGYPTATELKREYLYNHFRPFRWAWVAYLIAFVMLAAFLVTSVKLWQWVGTAILALGFSIHTLGFVLRMLISGRPPVTNMYESVIWVSWGCVLFSFFIGASYRRALIPAAASVFSIVALVLADTLPSVLDPSIQPLEPVLRSNFWLTIHVLTITLSYAAFALSLCLGNVVLGTFVFRPKKTESIQFATLYMYRSIQIGVVLLAAGTILGGVWADYSWGRFWGWDPKEVWALIALLLYLAVLHGRFAGWLRGFGFAATAVLSFLGVLMAWYGVNFVLGAGLHSYGFGAGGTGYVSIYALAQIAFIGVAYYRYVSSGAKARRAAIFPNH